MKFICNRETILSEIQIAYDAISSKSLLSILSNVLLELNENKLQIKSTDLKVSFSTTIPVESENQGSISVFCDKFLGILRSLPDGDIEFEKGDDMILDIRPKSAKVDFKLRCVSPDKFPQQPDIPDDAFFAVPQAYFMDMIAKTIFAVSDDETRHFLNGVFLEKNDDNVIMVASDGRRLSYISNNIKADAKNIEGVIIPPKILNMVRKICSGQGNLMLAVTDKNIFVKINNRLFISNLIEGSFPNYQKVIPEKHEHSIIVSKEVIETALKRVSILVEEKTRRILFTLNQDMIELHSEESEIGMAKEDIPCQYNGPEITLTLNYLYMIEPIREINEEEIRIEFTDNFKAIVIKPLKQKNYFSLVMPVQKE